MAIKVYANVEDDTAFDGTEIAIPITLQAMGQADKVRHTFSGVAANIPNAAAILPYIKTQIISYVQAQYSLTVVESEIAVKGAPQ